MMHWTHAVGDLAPGDLHCASFDWSEFQIISVTPKDRELFEAAYSILWAEFGEKGEVEPPETLLERLTWNPFIIRDHRSLAYELIVVLKNNVIVALRDHTVITQISPGHPQSVIHLSHAWIIPEMRRLGISGWLRAWPIQKARECLHHLKLPPQTSITLAAEMEPLDPNQPDRIRRLKSYAKAQFSVLDPQAFTYAQPDFRPPPLIDQSGGPISVPLHLLLRRLGRETEPKIHALEARNIIESLYSMYSTSIRAQDMAPLWKYLAETFQKVKEEDLFHLLPPFPKQAHLEPTHPESRPREAQLEQ